MNDVLTCTATATTRKERVILKVQLQSRHVGPSFTTQAISRFAYKEITLLQQLQLTEQQPSSVAYHWENSGTVIGSEAVIPYLQMIPMSEIPSGASTATDAQGFATTAVLQSTSITQHQPSARQINGEEASTMIALPVATLSIPMIHPLLHEWSQMEVFGNRASADLANYTPQYGTH